MAITTTTLGNLNFRYRGTWNSGTSYIVDDVVDYNSQDYVAIAAGTNQTPIPNKIVNSLVTTVSSVFNIDGVAQPVLSLNRGDKYIFNLNSSTNNGQVLQFSAAASSQSSNLYTNGVSYFLNNVSVSASVFQNVTTFNAATQRRIELQTDNTTPTTLYYFSFAGGATYGSSITTSAFTYWRNIKQVTNFRGTHNNTGQTYQVGDVVYVPVRVNNNNSTYIAGQYVTTDSYYICIAAHTNSGADSTLPQNQSVASKWQLLESEHDYDDTTFTVRGDILTVGTFSSGNGLRTSGTYMGCISTGGSGTDQALFNIVITAGGVVSSVEVEWPGAGYVVGDTLTVSDAQLGGGGAPAITFQVATVGKYVKGQTSMYSGQHRDCISLSNRDGVIGEFNRYYRKYGHYAGKNVINHMTYIDGSGGIKTMGSSSNNGVVSDQNVMTNMTFPFLDWYRSTDNGGTGVHSTPDGQVPKCIQLEIGYNAGMALFNNGELYHWGFGTNGENGNDATSTVAYPVRVGGSYANVFAGNNSSTHKFLNVRIVKCWISNKNADDTGTHSCYALDDAGNLWAWGYGGQGQLAQANTSNQQLPVIIVKATYFNNNAIVGFWCSGATYVHCLALDSANRIYAWGYNAVGQLGINNTTAIINVPTEITNPLFSDATNGRISKVLKDDYSGNGRTAILTDKGKIFTTGYNFYGWMGNGNTTNLQQFTIMGSGPGAATNNICKNMWFTGNGQYHSIFMQDRAGNITACGRNNNGQLGDNSTTDRSSVVTPLWRIKANNYALLDVKYIGGHSTGDQHRTHVLTNNGWLFVAGRNSYGCSSMGFDSTYVNDRTNANNIEENTAAVFQLPRMLNDSQGNVDEVQSFGYGVASIYLRTEIRTKDYRYLSAGYSGSSMSGHHSSPSETIFQAPSIG